MFRKIKNEKPKRRNYLRPDQIQVHDFAKASKYFSTEDEKELYEDMDTLENNKRYIGWIQSFSKKIVSVTFCLYLVSVAFSIGMVWYSFQTGTITGIDTFITESNTTFREVVGGYIIKSAVENAVKIAGNYYIGIADAKLNALREKLGMESNDTSNNEENTSEESDDEIDNSNLADGETDSEA
jgi:hypothetical protein